VGEQQVLETDYLVVGAGTLGMGFVDALLDGSDADVVVVDRRHAPGGHWLDAYPFVRLHQPSEAYGVASLPLGSGRVDTAGPEPGFHERASGAEICGYYDRLLHQRFVPSGRVRFLAETEHLGGGRLRSCLTGAVTEVEVRVAVVDATRTETKVPATDPPPFPVADGVRWVPVGGLAHLDRPARRVVVAGAGKTAFDAVVWLQEQGVDPADITWPRVHDPWLLERSWFQPGDGAVRTLEGVVLHVEAAAESDSIAEVYHRLEEHGVVVRIDPEVEPTVLRGATISRYEIDLLRRVGDVVRMGYIERVEPGRVVLEGGEVPLGPDDVVVHCASRGLAHAVPEPIFGEGTVVPQVVTRTSICLSAGLVGHLEASGRSTEEKNRLLPPNPWPETPFDWTRHTLCGLRTEAGWGDAPDLSQWVNHARMDLTGALRLPEHHDAARPLYGRLFGALFPALEKLPGYAARATPAERARMYEPA
jgi:hypothetical protein